MDTLIRLSSAEYTPIVLLAMLGVLYVTLSIKPRSSTSTRMKPVRRPGWIARRRARRGVQHKHDQVGVGYTSATRSVHLSLKELAGHGLTLGGPGSGKTTFLQLLVEAAAGRTPVVIVDPKGSPALERTVRAHGGIVWAPDGKVPADLLDPAPGRSPTCYWRPRTIPPTRARTAMQRTSGRCGRPGRSPYATSRWIWPDCGRCSTV
jgi:hypothetical protein